MRAAYGGLAGDVAMLRRFSQLWLARFSLHCLHLLPLQTKNAAAHANGYQHTSDLYCPALTLVFTQLTTIMLPYGSVHLVAC